MYKSIIGAVCIVIGTILSNNINHPILSPIVFSVGILLVIDLDLGLITRSVPSGDSSSKCCYTAMINIVVALLLGLLLGDVGNYPTVLNVSFGGAVATGVIIGLVSVANKYSGRYTILITMILMFSFVYLRLPHCVVYAFYLGALPMITWEGIWSVLVTIAGNVGGGLLVRFYVREMLFGDEISRNT